MNLTKTSQYALKILNYMVINEGNVFTAQSLHNKLKIPHQYLRRLLTKLSNKGLIKGGKGRGGGYLIAKNYDSIFLADILKATGESEIFNSCIFGFSDCLLAKKCIIHDKWSEAREIVTQVLQTTNLGHLKKDKLNNFKNKNLKTKKKKNYG